MFEKLTLARRIFRSGSERPLKTSGLIWAFTCASHVNDVSPWTRDSSAYFGRGDRVLKLGRSWSPVLVDILLQKNAGRVK